MKTGNSILYSLLALICALTNTFLQAETALYTSPSETGEPIAVMVEDPAVLGIGYPVDDPELAAQGWGWMDYPGNFEGYVAPEDINEDSGIKEGATIYQKPDKESPVVTVFSPGDKASVTRIGSWGLVSMNKQIPVFFKSDSPIPSNKPDKTITEPEAVIETEVADEAITATETVVVEPVEAEIPEVEVIEETSDEAVFAEAEMNAYTPEVVEAEPTATTYRPRQERPTPRKNEQVQDFEGVLSIAKRGLRNKTGFSFVLKDIRGKRIAVVDTRNTPVHPIEKYIDKSVVVNGVMEPLPYAKKYRVIRAQLIRVK